MKRNRFSVLLPLVPLLVTSWLVMALVDPGIGEEHLAIGAILGTISGHTTLAAAWTALGPGPLRWRLPLALAWCILLIVALAAGLNGPPAEIVVTLAACVAGQWLALQAPLWFLSASYGLQIHYRGMETETSIRPLQFGTRQLMIVTAILAVLLGVGRALVTTIDASSEVFAFIFLAVAGILMSLPLLLACLLPRWAVRSVLILLALIAAATWGEYPLLQELGGDGPEFWHFMWINFFQSAWIVFVITLLRAFGYGCGNPHAPAPKASFDS